MHTDQLSVNTNRDTLPKIRDQSSNKTTTMISSYKRSKIKDHQGPPTVISGAAHLVHLVDEHQRILRADLWRIRIIG